MKQTLQELQELTKVRELLYQMWRLTRSDTAFDAYNRARIRELDAKLVMRGK